MAPGWMAVSYFNLLFCVKNKIIVYKLNWMLIIPLALCSRASSLVMKDLWDSNNCFVWAPSICLIDSSKNCKVPVLLVMSLP